MLFVILYRFVELMQAVLDLDALCPLTSSQPNRLSVLLQLRDELITLLYNIIVLLVLVIWPIRLNYALTSDTINGAWDTVGCNELCKVTNRDHVSQIFGQSGNAARTGLGNQQ